jgi:hypothetical protein
MIFVFYNHLIGLSFAYLDQGDHGSQMFRRSVFSAIFMTGTLESRLPHMQFGALIKLVG